MMSHTTGPWEYEFVGHDAQEFWIMDSAGFLVADAQSSEVARLIAAAPDLLEALVSLINSMPESEIDIARECIGHTNAGVWLHWRNNALAVIDQATAQ